MKEKRLRKIVQASKERDMLLRMISLFKHNEDYYGRLEFYDRYAVGNITDKVIFVLNEWLKDEEDYIRHLLNEKEKVFEFPQDSQIELPEKYNEEWLKTASMEDKIKFLDEFMNGFNYDSIKVRQQTKIDELNEEEFK